MRLRNRVVAFVAMAGVAAGGTITGVSYANTQPGDVATEAPATGATEFLDEQGGAEEAETMAGSSGDGDAVRADQNLHTMRLMEQKRWSHFDCNLAADVYRAANDGVANKQSKKQITQQVLAVVKKYKVTRGHARAAGAIYGEWKGANPKSLWFHFPKCK